MNNQNNNIKSANDYSNFSINLNTANRVNVSVGPDFSGFVFDLNECYLNNFFNGKQ